MAIISSQRIFYVDSHDRISGTLSDFTYQFDLQTTNYDYAVVLQATIPKSYYLVQNGQNTFQLQELSSTVTISMPIGNYSRSSFKTQLQTSLNASSPNSWVYTVSIPNTATTADTGYYTFSVASNSGQPSFIMGNYLYEQFGLNANTTYTFTSNSLVSVNVVNFQLQDSLFIHSDLANNGVDDILQEILGVDSPNYGNIVYVCPSVEGYAKQLSSNPNNVYHFKLTDEDDNAIDLNGQNIVFSLLFFKKQNVYDLIKKMIKLTLLQQ